MVIRINIYILYSIQETNIRVIENKPISCVKSHGGRDDGRRCATRYRVTDCPAVPHVRDLTASRALISSHPSRNAPTAPPTAPERTRGGRDSGGVGDGNRRPSPPPPFTKVSIIILLLLLFIIYNIII